MMIRCFLLSSLVYTSLLVGATAVGNSGHGVVCKAKNAEKRSLRLLEYAYLDQKKIKFLEPEKKLDYWQRVRWLLNNYARYDYKHATELFKKWHEIAPKIVFVKGPLRRPGDVPRHPVQEVDCEGYYLVQLARQFNKRNGEFVVRIDRGLFEELSVRDQAGLILHEIVTARAINKRNAAPIYDFVSLVSSTKMKETYQRLGKEKFSKLFNEKIFGDK